MTTASLVVLSALVFLLGINAVDATRTLLVPANDSSISYEGRFYTMNDDGSQVQFDWSGVGISITFDAGVDQVEVVLMDNGNYYDVYIDGEMQNNTVVTTANATAITYNVTSGLDNTQPHVVAIRKRTEAAFGIVTFYGFILSSNSDDVQPKTLPSRSKSGDSSSNPRVIEFLGDSLTCAYGNLGIAPCSFTPATEDANRGFVTLAAQLLQVDSYHIECWSGKGVVRNYGYNETTSPDPFPIYFNRTLGNDPSLIWNFTSYTPSVVVVTLGGNDYSTQPAPSFQQFYDGYSALLDNIFRVYNPSVLEHVFCVCGPLVDDPCEAIQQVVTQYNSTLVSFISLAGTLSVPTDYGCDGHPSAQGDIKISKYLATEIAEVVGWNL
eukprot:TRINITY_DN10302_c0_g1_i1.p1 TRINITY_DN10302_c0_g1~~TRINITY_DN10302_c0_g1_i1.p1  ORF type:complete len:398 (-),score=82.37 TRINITY_DN10302_c0_g1_i1:70-1212(-)